MAPGTKRRSSRQAATRKRSIYAEPDTDDDFVAEGEDEVHEPEQGFAQEQPTPKKRKVARTRKPQTRSKAAKTKQTSLKRTLKIGKPRKARSKPVKKGFGGPSDGRIPKWTDLPLDILKQVFIYASNPINEYTRDAGNNVTWLLRSARFVCKAFFLPALEAFYQSPPMLNSERPYAFLELLRKPKEQRCIDYNVKVQSLKIDVRTLAYVGYNKAPFDLCQLISELPRLQHMEILHPRHLPPFRPMKVQRWTFSPTDLIKVFEERDIHLRTWRWSREMIPKTESLELYSMMSKAHKSSAFAYTTRLVVSGFNVDDSLEPTVPDANEVGQPIPQPPGLATAIAKLPSLTDLTFISCDIIMEKFLQRLPNNLQRLELSNCLEITSDMLRDFFKTSGSELKELELYHNAALNLSFTTGLKELCPKLEVLKMDLHYYSEKFTVNDAEPLYDYLLGDHEIPTWPTTMRQLEIINTPSKWSPAAAQNMFRSLADAAPGLLDLRTLVIHAHINIPWRDRVGFRDQWIERLRRIYLRRSDPPCDCLGSIRQFKMWKKQQALQEPGSGSRDELANDSDDDLPIRSRRVKYVQVSPHKPSGDTDHYSESEAPHETPSKRQPRRSKRVADWQVAIASKTTTPSPESESETEEESGQEDWRKTPEKFIQGLCGTVDIRIDNQRPRENQWTEGDFLDSEASGDEDWNEDAEEPEETYAW